MSFQEYLQEFIDKSKQQSKLDLAVVSDFIDIMNNLKNYEREVATSNRKSFPLFFQREPKNKYNKIENIINEISKYKELRGKKAILKFIQILKENGYLSDSKPFIDLMKKFGTEVLDLYVSLDNDEEIPAFLKK